MGTEYIIDCAGNKIPVGDKLFSAKCWFGNTADYLIANENYIIDDLKDCDVLPKVSIIIPIYRSGKSYIPTLKSLCSQNWSNPDTVEIILYINQPLGETDLETKESIDEAQKFIIENDNNTKTPNVKVHFEKLSGGLAEVYQRAFSTLVYRIRNCVEKLNLKTKDENSDEIGRLMTSTVFAVMDDDQILLDTYSLPNAIDKIAPEKSAIMGQVEITSVSTSNHKWDECLTGVMNLFFKFKYEHDSVILTPRALTVSDLFHIPAVKIGDEYADQIWFSTAVGKKERYMIDVTTTLEEEDYPSNAQMASRISTFLETGEGNNSLDIFRNLRGSYKTVNTKIVYTLSDVDSLIEVLETRDITKIEAKVNELLNKI